MPFLPLREVVFRRRYEPMGWQRSHADTLATCLVGNQGEPGLYRNAQGVGVFLALRGTVAYST